VTAAVLLGDIVEQLTQRYLVTEVLNMWEVSMGGSHNWLLLHNNAPALPSVLVQEELAKQNVTVLPQRPCSTDLAQYDFFFFPCLKRKRLRGSRFQSAEENITATREAVRDLPPNVFQ
jgi:hypothetical protein